MQAAAQGIVNSQHALGYCYENGQGIERDIVQAYYWYALAARMGDSKSIKCVNGIVHGMTRQQMTAADILLRNSAVPSGV